MGAELTNIDPLREIIETQPLGIFSDIDGTLAPIVSDPARAAISPRAKELVERLVEGHVKVALVSGREVEVARRMVGIDGLAYAGNHGLHIWMNGREETTEAAQEYAAQARVTLEEIGGVGYAGVEVEDKGPVLAFHYRNASDEGAAREAILGAIDRAPSAAVFGVYEGRKVIELRPPLEINKGTAILHLAEALGVRAAIAVGDDLTDIDMFRGIEQLRRAGIPGVSVAVWSEEVSVELLEVTDHYVRGVAGVEWLLESVLTGLPG